MPAKVCCVTGHRMIPSEQLERVEFELRGLIRQAIGAGYYTFISGFAEGADLVFARLVLALCWSFKLSSPCGWRRRSLMPDG